MTSSSEQLTSQPLEHQLFFVVRSQLFSAPLRKMFALKAAPVSVHTSHLVLLMFHGPPVLAPRPQSMEFVPAEHTAFQRKHVLCSGS
jgi:hypothetical protein